jgi:transposase-like protein
LSRSSTSRLTIKLVDALAEESVVETGFVSAKHDWACSSCSSDFPYAIEYSIERYFVIANPFRSASQNQKLTQMVENSASERLNRLLKFI